MILHMARFLCVIYSTQKFALTRPLVPLGILSQYQGCVACHYHVRTVAGPLLYTGQSYTKCYLPLEIQRKEDGVEQAFSCYGQPWVHWLGLGERGTYMRLKELVASCFFHVNPILHSKLRFKGNRTKPWWESLQDPWGSSRILKDPAGILQGQDPFRILSGTCKDPTRILQGKDPCRILRHEPGSWQDPAKILEGSLEVRIPAGCRIMNQDPGRILAGSCKYPSRILKGKDPCRIQSHEPGSWQDPAKILEGSLEVRIPARCRIMNQDPGRILQISFQDPERQRSL